MNIKHVGVIFILTMAAVAGGCGKTESAEPIVTAEITESVSEPVIEIVSDDKAPETAESMPAALPSDVGIHEECLSLIEDIIETDIQYGFTSAQLAIIKDGRLVYENAWGKINAGSDIDATTDTLYDLASVSKMFGVNYAIQKLVTDGELNLDEKVTDYLGDRFADDVAEIHYDKGDNPDIETQKVWKQSLTIKELLMHQGGFPPDPAYFNPHFDTEAQEYDPEKTNLLFAGNGADEETKNNTIEAICRTPLLYEPGTRTVYSDVDYMILGLIVEQVTGSDLDTYLKETFCEPMGLKHMTYKPLEHGFTVDDCAATELHGNTRDGAVYFDGIREYTLQGEVHDEKAYYNMGGISGHAGLFSNAADLARLAELMLTGRYEDTVFFSEDVIREFTMPESDEYKNWGLGWWRQGDMQRTNYFGSAAREDTFGHPGWTGTLIMTDPEKKLVIAYLTNKINSPVTDKISDPNKFDGNWYTASTLGFVPEILYIGMDREEPVDDELMSAALEFKADAEARITKGMPSDHPARRNLESKKEILSHLSDPEGLNGLKNTDGD
ncbi:MAG: penicillin binding protein PBP4B [Lachnospiraceae bacterium]|nr:penicillin binding protein PBP4B [Lachnospiraceae bacterium]